MKLHAALLALVVATVPAPAQQPLSRIVFGSCADQERVLPIWEPIVAIKPELFLFIGDNIYADTTDMKVMKAKYDKLGVMPGYQKLLKTCPVWAVWDDHDYGKNDAGEEYPKKKESQQILLEFFKEPKDSPRWQREGLYDAKVFGPTEQSVQVIMLDTRYFRSKLKKRGFVPGQGSYVPTTDPSATILGKDQWHWLEEQLKVPAKLRLLISSIQVVSEDHHWEKWMNIPHERDRLFKLIRDTQAGGVIALSGDRHLAEISMMDAGIGYPLYDVTSSGLNQAFQNWRPLEVNRHRVGTMNFGNNFGVITVDWKATHPLVSMQIRDEEGDIILQQKVALRDLQPGFLKTTSIPGRVKLADGSHLTPELVKEHLKKKIGVGFTVEATGMSSTSGLIFLNSLKDRSSPDNFTVVIDKKAQEAFKQAGIDAPRTHFMGKAIWVNGVLSQFRQQPQIIVSDPAQIEIQK